MDKKDGIFALIIVVLLIMNIAAYKEIKDSKAGLALNVGCSMSQEEWKECRAEAWNGCFGDYEGVVQPMNARYDRRDKETLKYVEPLISYCWDNVAEYKCDARFDMKNKK